MGEPKSLSSFRKKLEPNEFVIAWLGGYTGKMMGSGDNVQKNGILVLTNLRVCFYGKFLFAETIQSISLDKISSVNTYRNIYQIIKLSSSGISFEFKTLKINSCILLSNLILKASQNPSAASEIAPISLEIEAPKPSIFKGMLKVASVVVIVLITIAIFTNDKKTTGLSKTFQSEESGVLEEKFTNEIITELGGMFDNWYKLETNEVSDDTYHLTLVYQNNPDSFGEVRKDTFKVVRAVLSKLIRDGKNQNKFFSIYVYAHSFEGLGETGKILYQQLGRSYYNSRSDKIEWEIAPEFLINR